MTVNGHARVTYYSMNRAVLHITPVRALRGALRVPGDKSISHRYAMIGAIARGTTAVKHLAPGADVAATVACLRALGVEIETDGAGGMRVTGRGRLGLRPAAGPIDAANSGTTMRLLSGLVAAHPFRTTIAGDESLARRPMRRVIDPLTAMGARISAVDSHAPLEIDGGDLTAIDWTTPVPSAQVKSAILFAGLHANGTTSVREPLATRDHTERMLRAFGIDLTIRGLGCSIAGGQEAVAPAGIQEVPGDPSSAAVWAAAAAALPGSEVRLERVCLNPYRIGFVGALERMGAKIAVAPPDELCGEPVGTIQIAHGAHAETSIGPDEVPALIDELPVLAARAALGGRLEVTGAGELRVKESDRISALVTGLRQLGVDADERPDGFVITGGRRPRGGIVDAAGDHRLVMAFTLVGLGGSGLTTINGAGAVAVSYPGFRDDLAALATP
jgi:3-phosphoshikimate 1-carboxyvinyltransferase